MSNVWKLANGRNAPVSTTARDLKLYLDRVKAKIIKNYDDFILSGRPFNAEMLKMKFFGIDVTQHKLCELIEFHNENCGLKDGGQKYQIKRNFEIMEINAKKNRDFYKRSF